VTPLETAIVEVEGTKHLLSVLEAVMARLGVRILGLCLYAWRGHSLLRLSN